MGVGIVRISYRKTHSGCNLRIILERSCLCWMGVDILEKHGGGLSKGAAVEREMHV